MLTKLAGYGELFHTAAGTAFADLLIDGHRETWSVRGGRFRAWLRQRYYQETGAANSDNAFSLDYTAGGTGSYQTGGSAGYGYNTSVTEIDLTVNRIFYGDKPPA